MMRWLRYLPSPPRVMINEKLDHGGMLIQPAWQVGTNQTMGQSGKGEVRQARGRSVAAIDGRRRGDFQPCCGDGGCRIIS